VVAEKEADAVLLLAAWFLSPRVEPTAPGLCTMDLAGRNRTDLCQDLASAALQLEGQGLPVRVGIADTPLTARFAAHVAQSERWVDDSATFLASLPVSLLDLTPTEETWFASLGLRTLSDVTRLPRSSFSQRLGIRGDRLWSMAAGEESRPLDTAMPPARFEAHVDLEHAAETLEPLLFVLRRFVDRLTGELNAAGLAAESLTLCLRLENETTYVRSFRLPEATARADVLFGTLENHLATVQTPSAVAGLDLAIQPTRPQQRQDGLFDLAVRDPHAFYDTLARAGSVLGPDRVGTPVKDKSHRPDVFTTVTPPATVPEYRPLPAPPPRGPVLRRLRPPAPATIELAGEVPRYVQSRMAEGAVVGHRGPFRLSGNWWEKGGWSREEWDVEIGTGGLYRLLHAPSGWFVEGIYD
jgi:protein ImuB